MTDTRLARTLPILVALGLTGALIILTTATSGYYYLMPSLPSAETLRDVELQTPLRVYTRDGRLMAQLGEKRRTPVVYEDIPEIVIQAFLAAEDDRFFDHPGFDYQGIARAAFNLLRTGSRRQGGSTITQQLARVYFLTRERSFVRKAKELILALQIEREFSKEDILALYLNKIFLGQRAYGVGAAAEVYFGKSLDELNVAEAATIAGIPKAPSVLNPVSNVDRATERRAYVLRRMRELDFIDEPQYEAAAASHVESKLYGPKVELKAPYVTEMVRAEMVRRYGLEAYTAGFNVITTIDSRLQIAAQKALRVALLEYDRRHGYRGPIANHDLTQLGQDSRPVITESDELPADPEMPAVETQVADESAADDSPSIESMLNDLLRPYGSPDDLNIAVVVATGEDDSAEMYVRSHGYISVPWENLKWRAYINDDIIGGEPESIEEMVAVGDLVYLLNTETKGWQLAQIPQVQGAFVSLDPHDGATVALVGGFDFYTSEFNRAVQTKRQPGSSFKPFIYSAALENGFTTATLVNDAPVVFDDDALETAWRPENYSRKFHGPTRLREALVKSLNLVSVRILRGTGLGPALRHIEPFGLPPSALPRDLSLALGSGGASPWDLAAGYATFASGGFRVDHYVLERVEDSNGNVVFQATPSFVCAQCDSVWFEERDSDAPPETITSEIISPDAQPGWKNEVPVYSDVAEMTTHGLAWRPTADETPVFFAATPDSAPRIITAENAYLIYDMMRDVIQRGTGRRARDLDRPDIAGKTGTSNDRRDAWFSGFNGDLVATAWVGFDQDRSLGAGEEGSRTALPVWKYFMKEALANTSKALIQRPPGIITARIIPESGLIAPSGYNGAIFEIFREGHVPLMNTGDSGSAVSPDGFDNLDDDETIF
jgi:penicillin-binding protein 1A